MTDPKTNRPRPDFGAALNPPQDDDLTAAYIAGAEDVRKQMAARIKALEAENARLRNLYEAAFREGFHSGNSLHPNHYEVMDRVRSAWRCSRARAALDGESDDD